MQVKNFKEEDMAKAFVKTAQGCSAVGHGSKGAYVGVKTTPVEAIAVGIASACKTLDLKVDLGFEWIPGLTWGQCH